MTDKAGPPTPSVNGPVAPPASQAPPDGLPPFVCVLPCTESPVKYLDRLDGCARGLHVTLEDTKDLQLSLYGTMADAITAKEDQVGATSPDPCAVCKAPMVARPRFLLLYMENCAHIFHYGCLDGSRRWLPHRFSFYKELEVVCPQCPVKSSRVLLWPELFASEAAKRDTFELQKRSLGLDVAPQTELQVRRCSVDNGFPTIALIVNSRCLTVRKRRPNDGVQAYDMQMQTKSEWEALLMDHGPYRPGTRYGRPCNCIVCVKGMNQARKSQVLPKLRCPFDRRQEGCPNSGRCSGGNCDCEFWHESANGTVMSQGVERLVPPPEGLRDFPRFFCVRNSRIHKTGPRCTKRLQVHTQEMVRCLAGFHPTVEDLENVDEFACKMAKQVMAPAVVPEPEEPLNCAICHQPPSSPNSVRLNPQNCGHWLHDSCLAQARLAHPTNPNGRKLDLPCPTCQVPSVRMLAWPGPFQSELMKKTIFERQLKQFKLAIQADTQLAIVQVPNQVNVFTLDYGGPSVVTIDLATARDDWTILYD